MAKAKDKAKDYLLYRGGVVLAGGLPVAGRWRGMEMESEAEQELEVEVEVEVESEGSGGQGWMVIGCPDRGHSPVPHQARRSPCRPGRSCEIGGQAWRCWASAWAGPVMERGRKSRGAGGERGGQRLGTKK